MSKAPENIWLLPSGEWTWVFSLHPLEGGDIEYIRADIAQARIEELEEAILQHKSVVGATDISNVEDDHILWALVEHKEGEHE